MSDDINFLQFLIQWLIEFFPTKEGIALISVLTIVGTIITILTLRDFSQKHKKDSEKQPSISDNPQLTPISNFTAQLGNPKNPGFLDQPERLKKIQPGQNPYFYGPSLPGNSPLFYGRQNELHSTLSVLRHPDQPGNVSILGERRIGKSSLLNQIYQALSAEQNVVAIRTTMQDWRIESQADFFKQLHQAICDALKLKSEPIAHYEQFRDFIHSHAKKYRFVLMIDEFDKMTNNAYFDAEFFSNMRALGERHEYRFAYVLSSYAPLSDICHQGGIQESKFWNIFGTNYILGLLDQKAAEQLIQQPLQQSIGRDIEEIQPLVEKVCYYAGYHPAFIQLVMTECWNALYHGTDVNNDAIQLALYAHYQDLWDHRSQAEQELLLKIANHEQPRENVILMTLRQRGLLTKENQLFAKFFEQMIISRLG
jgi:hypothetical protein